MDASHNPGFFCRLERHRAVTEPGSPGNMLRIQYIEGSAA